MSSPAPLPPVHKTYLMRVVEEMHGGRDVRLVLIDLYNALGSQRAVARRLGLSQPTITHWFAMLGIEAGHRSARLADRPRSLSDDEWDA